MTTKKKQRVTLFLNPNLLTHAKAQAVIKQTTLTALVESALMKYLPEETVLKKTEIRTDLGVQIQKNKIVAKEKQ